MCIPIDIQYDIMYNLITSFTEYIQKGDKMVGSIWNIETEGTVCLTRIFLEEIRQMGVNLVIKVRGVLIFEKDITPELARATIQSVDVTGFLFGWSALLPGVAL